MADVLNDADVRKLAKSNRNSRGGYAWSEWLDGRWHALTPGVDFLVRVNVFRSVANYTAKRRGLRVTCCLLTDGRLAVRALPKPDPQP